MSAPRCCCFVFVFLFFFSSFLRIHFLVHVFNFFFRMSFETVCFSFFFYVSASSSQYVVPFLNSDDFSVLDSGDFQASDSRRASRRMRSRRARASLSIFHRDSNFRENAEQPLIGIETRPSS